MKDTKSILDNAYPHVEECMKKNLNNYKKYMSKFINNRTKQLYSNMPTEQIYFSDNDINELFEYTGIDKKKISNTISMTYYYPMANFNPRYAKDECTVALLCIVRYFKLKNMNKELELALINMAFSGKYYPSIWYRSFPIAAPQENIMEYVITHMVTNKYDIAREGNVIGAIKSISETWHKTYLQRFKDFHDDDAVYLIQQLHNRIGSFMINIADLYYQAYDNKDYITYDSDDVSEDNYRLADSDSFKLERIVSSTMTYINNHGVNQLICKRVSDQNVKINEIKSIIEVMLSDNKNIPLLKECITLMIACYFRQSKTKDVRDMDFVVFCMKSKPNTKDQYLLRQKELIEILLTNNSEHFARRRNRLATEQSYFRALNAYLALIIQEAIK